MGGWKPGGVVYQVGFGSRERSTPRNGIHLHIYITILSESQESVRAERQTSRKHDDYSKLQTRNVIP